MAVWRLGRGLSNRFELGMLVALGLLVAGCSTDADPTQLGSTDLAGPSGGDVVGSDGSTEPDLEADLAADPDDGPADPDNGPTSSDDADADATDPTDDTGTETASPDTHNTPQPCADAADCEEGQWCDGDTGTCQAADAKSCWPCATHDDCGPGSGARCVAWPDGQGNFCGTSCAAGCPQGTSCQQVKLVDNVTTQRCVPDEGALCACPEAAEGLSTGCSQSNDYGTCEGVAVCEAGGGLSTCDAPMPAAETCDGTDEDCNGVTDDPGTPGCVPYYMDSDGDGLGADDVEPQCLCAATGDYSAEVAGDCDDSTGAVGACEVYYADVDGDGFGDEADWQCLCQPEGIYSATEPGCAGGSACETFYLDADKDGLGVSTDSLCLCAPWEDYTAVIGGDCDDSLGAVGACTMYWYDGDDDGAGATGNSQCLCAPEGGYTALVGGDCNDTNADETPGKVELCDGSDNDCDGWVDEPDADGCTTYYWDADGDGYGVTGQSTCACGPYDKYTTIKDSDCNDLAPDVYPGQPCEDPVCDAFIISGLCPDGTCGATGTAAAPCPGGFACLDATSCRLTCTQPSHCAPGHTCQDYACVLQSPDGSSCSDDSDCESGYCSGGICCAGGDCCTEAASCDDGNPCTDDGCSGLFQCTHVANADPCGDATCGASGWVGPAWCDAGTCKTPPPVSCQTGTEACISYGCEPEVGCIEKAADAGLVCKPGGCLGFELVGDSTCDGAGTCVPGEASPCPDGYGCADATMCASGCTASSQCQPDSYCDAGTCVPKGNPGDACASDEQCYKSTCQGGQCCDGCCDTNASGIAEFPRAMELCGYTGFDFHGHAKCGRVISTFGQFSHDDHSPELDDTLMVQLSSGMPEQTGSQNGGEDHDDVGGKGPDYSSSYPDPDDSVTSVYDLCGFELSLVVPPGAQGLAFDFIFFSSEYPEWVGDVYNDSFNAVLTSSGFNGNISFDVTGNPISINNVLFTICDGCDEPSTLLEGTGYDGGVGGSTGWLTTTVPVQAGETIHLYFSVYDEADHVWDSDVLLNNFRWLSFQPGTGPVTE